MIRKTLLFTLLVLSQVACSHWTDSAPGVDYRHFSRGEIDAHVTRIDLDDPSLKIVVSAPSARGMTVAEVAGSLDAIVAINGDYFDEEHNPVGHSVGLCGAWESAGSARRQWVVGFADGRAEITHPEALDEPLPVWMEYAVSGWPLLVDRCRVITSAELPGSDSFTRAPHPRTAIGIAANGTDVYFVVADGRREGVPGMTLEELGTFMRDELGVCSALNLDGGGSTEMVLHDVIVNQPSDGHERRVGNHVAVVQRSFTPRCDDGVHAD